MTTTRLFMSAAVRRNIRRKNSSSSFSSVWRKEHQQQQDWIGTTRRSFSAAPPPAPALLSSSQLKHFQKQGLLDETGRTQYETLHELQTNACQIYADNPLFGTYQDEDEGFVWMTYQQFDETVANTRALLSHIGAGEHSKIGIISNNRWEWAALSCAAHSLNAAIVPMYEAQLPSDWTYILNDSGCTSLFCATETIYDQVRKEVLPNTPLVQACLCLDAPPGQDHAFATQLVQQQQEQDVQVLPPTPEDLANLIYTSGTTGKPKGVELVHRNLASNARAGLRTMVDEGNYFRPSDRSLAFLPWAHSFGQTAELWNMLSQGASMGVCRGIPHILEDLAMVRPTTLYSVPTLYKRIYDGVHNTIETTASPLRKRLMKQALVLGNHKARADQGLRGPLGLSERLQHTVLDRLVLSKIRDRFGGRLVQAFSGGAACPVEVIEFMDSLGIPLSEGYGLTETSPIIALSTPEKRLAGTVGQVLVGVQVYIVREDGQEVPMGQEGEICCVGPNVMRGYYQNEAATNEVMSVAPDGVSRMFHTGDMGVLDENGFLKVTGRLKEQYKLENGKYVVPTPIEEAITMSRFIHQAVLAGANRPHNVALLVPDWDAVRAELGIASQVSDDDLVHDKRVRFLVDAEITAHCYKVKKFEVPVRWAIVPPFTAENNMLTPKMSVRRHKVIETYQDTVDALYQNDGTAAAQSQQRQDGDQEKRAAY